MAKTAHSRNIRRLRTTAVKSAAAMRKGRESTEASVEVIRKRVALGIDALAAPTTADHTELGRILPEKISAMTSTSIILAERSTQLGYQFVRHTTGEMARAASHARSMMSMASPFSALAAQTTYFMGATERNLNFSLLVSSMSASLVDAALSPSHRTVMANARRLG